MSIRKLTNADRSPLSELLSATREFTKDEVEVALELIDAAILGDREYEALVAAEGDKVLGYICYGATAMTAGTYDLYWIAVDPNQKSKGIGRQLVDAMERILIERGGKLVRVETEGSDEYDATRAFYDRIGYERASVFRDFYRPGVDLVTYRRALPSR